MKPLQIATRFGLGLMCLFILGLSPLPVHAQTPLFSDNFDDGEFSDWRVQRNMQYDSPSKPCMNQDQPAAWEVKDGRLGITIDGPPCTTEITPLSLDLSTLKSFRYEFDWYLPESTIMDRNVIFIWKDANNWYDIKLFDNSIFIQKVVNGMGWPVNNSATLYDFQPHHSYHFVVTVLETGTIKVEINGQTVIDAQDPIGAPRITGFKTIGLQASVGAVRRSASYFDNLIVSEVATTTDLPVALLMQTDPAWKNQEYDTATRWSEKPTIGRWGCAMTSLAMVMRYYGLTALPDGQELTPATLNHWLKSQPDGYLGEGALNWIAATRLSRLISERYGTPKLEYLRHNSNSIEIAKTELASKKPVIFEIPGHFLVGSGVTADTNDLFIKDPAYSYQRLSQHSSSPISVRTFQPSFTDLSYILVAHKPGLTIQMKNEAGQTVALESFEDTIIDPIDKSDERTPRLIQRQVVKPSSGKYTLEISQPQFGEYEVQVLAYDDKATPTIFKRQGIVGPEPITLQLQYQKKGASTLTEKRTFTQLRQALKALKNTQHLRQQATYLKLDEVAKNGEKVLLSQQKRYLDLFTKTLQGYTPHFTQLGRTYLKQELKILEDSLRPV
ncbi:MAG TPA: C39 family peptidase [Vitreimonas sp.]|nr:C39 family peptidase [Vitreimonas sp.]